MVVVMLAVALLLGLLLALLPEIGLGWAIVIAIALWAVYVLCAWLQDRAAVEAAREEELAEGMGDE
jgi:uncharacterized membrane protein